jgi:intein/homing endonuclease
MGYKDEYGRNKGSLNQVMGVSAKDDSDKLRGKRGWILFEEMGSFQGLLELYDVTRKSVEDGDFTFACMYLVGCVCAGTKVWTLDGRNINIEELVEKDGIIGFTKKITLEDIHLNRGLTKEPILSDINVAPKECVRITLSNGNILECSKDHPIAIQKGVYAHKQMIGYDEIFRLAENIKVGDRVIEAREISTFGKDTLFDPRLVGMLIGDGTYGSSVKYCSEDEELKN